VSLCHLTNVRNLPAHLTKVLEINPVPKRCQLTLINDPHLQSNNGSFLSGIAQNIAGRFFLTHVSIIADLPPLASAGNNVANSSDNPLAALSTIRYMLKVYSFFLTKIKKCDIVFGNAVGNKLK
jgi:hypothetical protein